VKPGSHSRLLKNSDLRKSVLSTRLFVARVRRYTRIACVLAPRFGRRCLGLQVFWRNGRVLQQASIRVFGPPAIRCVGVVLLLLAVRSESRADEGRVGLVGSASSCRDGALRVAREGQDPGSARVLAGDHSALPPKRNEVPAGPSSEGRCFVSVTNPGAGRSGSCQRAGNGLLPTRLFAGGGRIDRTREELTEELTRAVKNFCWRRGFGAKRLSPGSVRCCVDLFLSGDPSFGITSFVKTSFIKHWARIVERSGTRHEPELPGAAALSLAARAGAPGTRARVVLRFVERLERSSPAKGSSWPEVSQYRGGFLSRFLRGRGPVAKAQPRSTGRVMARVWWLAFGWKVGARCLADFRLPDAGAERDAEGSPGPTFPDRSACPGLFWEGFREVVHRLC